MHTPRMYALAFLISLGLPVSYAQTPTQADGLKPSTAQQAVGAVLGLYAIDPGAKIEKTGAALPVNGGWSVSKERPAACPAGTVPCVKVFYTVPEDQVICEWVVNLTEGQQPAQVLSENEDAQRYLVRKIPDAERASLVVARKMPRYPAIAAAAHVQGEVVLRGIVTNDKLSSVFVASGPEMLRAAALDAARSWTFKPLFAGDQAVRYQMVLTFVFRTMGLNSASSVKATP